MVALYYSVKSLCRNLATAIIVLCIPVLAMSQSFENLESSFDGENVIITYDLVAAGPTSRFSVIVYSSHDRYALPLKAVKGDVGDNVLPGKGHVIVWEARNNLAADFSGEIVVKLKGAPSFSALAMEPLARSVYKKGEEVSVNWKGGLLTDQVEITLTKKNSVKKKLVQSMDNGHNYAWKIPKGISAGKHYGVTVTKVGETTDMSTMQPFRIKARIPLWLKVLPVVAVGVFVGIIIGDGGSGSDELPTPPLPTGG
jgi:hypothetical protein